MMGKASIIGWVSGEPEPYTSHQTIDGEKKSEGALVLKVWRSFGGGREVRGRRRMWLLPVHFYGERAVKVAAMNLGRKELVLIEGDIRAFHGKGQPDYTDAGGRPRADNDLYIVGWWCERLKPGEPMPDAWNPPVAEPVDAVEGLKKALDWG